MSNYVTEQIQAGGNDLTVLYPEKTSGALLGVAGPSLENAYPFKVKVVRTSSQKRFRVTFQERLEEGGYQDREFYRRLTKRGAMRKANRVLRRAINMDGVL